MLMEMKKCKECCSQLTFSSSGKFSKQGKQNILGQRCDLNLSEVTEKA